MTGADAPGPVGGGAGTPAELASVPVRAGARLVDLALAVTVVIAVVAVDDSLATRLVLAVAVLAFEVACLGLVGATPGKLLFRVRVVRAADGRGHLGWWPATVRTVVPLGLLPLVPPLGLVVAVVVELTAMLDPWQRGWHDRLARSLVVPARAVGDPPQRAADGPDDAV